MAASEGEETHPSSNYARIRDDIQTLRQGRGLREPSRVSYRSHEFKQAITTITGTPAASSQFLDSVKTVLMAIISSLDDELRTVAQVDLNISQLTDEADLGDRQQDLATHLGCSARKIRRLSATVIDTFAHHIATGKLPTVEVEEDSPKMPPQLRPTPLAQNNQRGVNDFWEIGASDTVDIVCSEIPVDERPYFADPADRNYLRYASFADLDSLVFVKTRLVQMAPQANVRDFLPSEYNDSHANHLLIIGGPPWNAKYRDFQSHLPFRFGSRPLGQDDPLILEDNTQLIPGWSSDGDLLFDYSTFVRITLKHGLKVYLLAGCLTLGVLGASRCFLESSPGKGNIAMIDRLVGEADFAVIARTERFGKIAQPPDLNHSDIIALWKRGPDRASRFQRVSVE